MQWANGLGSTMQVIPWVGCQSKMKSPNFEITETGRRKGIKKKNERFRVKMDFFLFLKMKNKTAEKSKKDNQI